MDLDHLNLKSNTIYNKDKVILDKKLPYEYNICLYILEESCDKGIIDVFEMAEAIILLKKKYKMPVISIYGKKDNNSSGLMFD